MLLEQLAKEVVKRSNKFMCGYADSWAYLINKKEKGNYTFVEVKNYIENNKNLF